jgi:serine O-acetyltransferase
LGVDLDRNGMRTSKTAVWLFRASQETGGLVSGLCRAVLLFALDVDIPARTRIGPGLILGHGGRGVVVHPNSVLGSRVYLHHRVTLAHGEDGRAPVIEDDCVIGTGAVVVGQITIGTGSAVAPNSVVRTDVPPHTVVAGNPAVVVSDRGSS